MRIIQCLHQNRPLAALVENERTVRLTDADTYTLARRAIADGRGLAEVVEASLTETRLDYQQLIDERRLLPPLTIGETEIDEALAVAGRAFARRQR